MPYGKVAKSAAAVADDADRVKSVSYRDNFLSGCQRPWVTKDGLWTVKGMDILSFSEFSDTLNASSDEMRAKPANGISEAASTLLGAGEALRDFQKKHLLGDGMDSLLNILERHQQAFEVLNTFGGTEVRRSTEHVKAAVQEVIDVMSKLGKNSKAQALVCDLRILSVRMAHTAQWLHSLMSMAATPVKYGKAVPRPDIQHGSAALKALQNASQAEAHQALIDFLTAALCEKNNSQGKHRRSKKSDVKTYTNLDLEEVDVEDKDDDLLDADVSLPSKKEKKPMQPQMQTLTPENMMSMMQQMMAQMMNLPRPSSAQLDLAAEVEAAAMGKGDDLLESDEVIKQKDKKKFCDDEKKKKKPRVAEADEDAEIEEESKSKKQKKDKQRYDNFEEDDKGDKKRRAIDMGDKKKKKHREE
jgi:hypothetical protein